MASFNVPTTRRPLPASARYIIAGGVAKVYRGFRQVHWISPPVDWNSLLKWAAALWILAQSLCVIGSHIAGRKDATRNTDSLCPPVCSISMYEARA